ncbi:MAG: nucleotidyltransferase domain-containing protein, partial [Thermoflexibacter sp.]|nr:nucleotidyltransferase domain-containing protein [Thermoflexibacter sp.]
LLQKKEIVTQQFKKTMQELYGDRLAKIVLYGSYARGDFHEESDIDFLVVLNDETIEKFKEIDYMRKKINRMEDELNIFISVNPMISESFNHAKTPFLHFVRKEGVVVQ